MKFDRIQIYLVVFLPNVIAESLPNFTLIFLLTVKKIMQKQRAEFQSLEERLLQLVYFIIFGRNLNQNILFWMFTPKRLKLCANQYF